MAINMDDCRYLQCRQAPEALRSDLQNFEEVDHSLIHPSCVIAVAQVRQFQRKGHAVLTRPIPLGVGRMSRVEDDPPRPVANNDRRIVRTSDRVLNAIAVLADLNARLSQTGADNRANAEAIVA